MRNLCKVALVLGVVALLASPALAQRPGGGGFGPMTIDRLVGNKSVQEEIKLEGDKLTKATDAIKKVQEDKKDDLAKLRDRNTSREERAEINKKLTEAYTVALKDNLSGEQMTRLNQIAFQQKGLEAYNDAEVQKTIKLDDTQKGDIKKILEGYAEERMKLFGGGMGGFNPQNQEKLAALRKDTGERITKMLSDDQKKAYEGLAGKPFEIKFERPQPRPNP